MFNPVMNAGMAGLGLASANLMSYMSFLDGVGIVIEVRDIEFPKWFVKFRADKNLESDLNSWMEILQRYVNEFEQAPEPDEAKRIVCRNCGFSNAPNAKFCGKCGNAIDQNREMICPRCGGKISCNVDFCTHCGAKMK